MMTIDDCVNVLRTNGTPRPELPANEYEGATVFASSTADRSATAEECDNVAFGHCPSDLREFWRLTRTAKLFEDVTTGQWGLEILAPNEAFKETADYKRDRARDAVKDDLIIGRFIGDSQLLLIRCDPDAGDFGNVIVVGPIDRRADWDFVANSFREFLNRYIESRGDMFWAESPTGR
jgi:SMI1 / KNR4 family (SUKH-1)